MSNPMMQNSDGSWSEAKPIPVQGFVAKTEFFLRRHGFKRVPNLLAAWDERNLGG